MLSPSRMATLVLLFSSFVLLCLQGCTPRGQQLSSQGVSFTGRGAFALSVAPPLRLAASGSLRPEVPADVMPRPRAGFVYALFGEGTDGPVTRHAHSIVSEVDPFNWRWEKETWAGHQSLYYSNLRAGGRNWTVQMFPVDSGGDWFSALWTLNRREVPPFWLARRWSSTPEDGMRIVAEYREAAPPCMQERLRQAAEAVKEDKNAPLPSGEELARHCEQAIKDFSLRADAALTFEAAAHGEEPVGTLFEARPSRPPDMGRLAGRVEHISRGDGSYRY